jgi:hypothetical protein
MTSPAIPEALLAKARAVYDKLGRGSVADEKAIALALIQARNEAIAEERAACAALVEDSGPATQDMTSTFICDALEAAAHAIRARP